MEGIIADTSVWIDFFNKKGASKSQKLREAALVNQLFICPIILQEILQGIRTDDQLRLCLDYLEALPMLDPDGWDAGVGAAFIYRKLRKNGLTVRKPNDCLIAWHAIAYDLPLLHNDKDFESIASFTPLKLI